MISWLKMLILSQLVIMVALTLALGEYTVVVPDSSPLVDGPETPLSDLARTDPDEQKAVYEIMAATGNGWAASIPDVCRGRWHGIECAPDQNKTYHVVSLSFGALSDDTAFPTCGPRARLSPALLRLPRLRALFLYRCLSGTFPVFLGRLGLALRSLVLRENGLAGPVPSEIGELTSLRVLDLHGNQLSSSIPSSLARLTRLRVLDLSNNRLAGAIPHLILPSLDILDLSRNLLHGPIPSSLTQCTSLIKMDLSRNQLTGRIPDSVAELKNLLLLDLSHNRLSGPLSSSIGSLVSLRALILKGNPMRSATIPADGFVGLKELATLVLSDMGLQGPIPESIAGIATLRVLHLDGNELNGSIPRRFGRMERLSELRVNDNRLTGSIPFSREMLWRMGRKLRVYNNSGLCYDTRNGSHDGVDALSGVGYCEAEPPTMAASAAVSADGGRKTEHLLSSGYQDPVSYSMSSASYHGCSVFRVVVLAAGFLFSAAVTVLK